MPKGLEILYALIVGEEKVSNRRGRGEKGKRKERERKRKKEKEKEKGKVAIITSRDGAAPSRDVIIATFLVRRSS